MFSQLILISFGAIILLLNVRVRATAFDSSESDYYTENDDLLEKWNWPFMNLVYSFPPYEDVRQVYLFTSSGPLIVDLQDGFCTGRNFSVWDNDVYLGTTVSIQNFCGISASNFAPIIEPTFVEVEYPLLAGFHNLTILITHSPIGNGVASLRVTLKPDTGVLIKNLQTFTDRWPNHRAN